MIKNRCVATRPEILMAILVFVRLIFILKNLFGEVVAVCDNVTASNPEIACLYL